MSAVGGILDLFLYSTIWPSLVALSLFAASGFAVLRKRGRLPFLSYTLAFAVVATVGWIAMWPDGLVTVSIHGPKVIFALLAMSLMPLLIIALPMLVIARFRYGGIPLASTALLGTIIATVLFPFFSAVFVCTFNMGIECV